MEVSTTFGPVSGMLRLLRASMIGVVMVLTGVIAHVSAGGLLPGPSALATLLVLNVLVATLFTGRPMPIRYIVLLIAGGQTAVHVGLSVTAGHIGESTLATAQIVNGDFAASALWQQLLSDLSAHAPMMVVHLMAAATVGMWLGVGERALWALVADAHTRLIRPLIALLAASAGQRGAIQVRLPELVEATILRPKVATLASSVVRRGPPVAFAA